VIDTEDFAALPPALAGLRLRHFRGPGDFAGMAAANMAMRLACGSEEAVTVATLTNQYAHLSNSDLEGDLAIVEVDGWVVGYVRVEWSDQNDGSRSYDNICFLDPAVRGRGIGTAMLRWSEARRREIASGHPADRPRWIGTETLDADEGAQGLLAAHGYRPVRTFYNMVRPTLDGGPVAVIPEGFEIRSVGMADMRTVWEADIKAFRDHWGSFDDSEEGFTRFVGDPRLDPSLHVVAFAGEEVAGAVINEIDDVENALFDRRRGLLDSVFVRRPYRRRGLARALIQRSLAVLRDRGMTSAWLGVDAENPNAALQLYRSCGFAPTTSTTRYRKPLELPVEET
jgi:ribosomal protein S18 acetylase RimI-like enzyme